MNESEKKNEVVNGETGVGDGVIEPVSQETVVQAIPTDSPSEERVAPAGGVNSSQMAYLIVGIVAAAVSAATVAYAFWWRARHLGPKMESVQQLLERCHEQVQKIEEAIETLNELQTTKSLQA